MPSPRTDDLDLPDVNVLVAILHPDHVHHSLAQGWLAETRAFATSAITEAGFLRLALNPSVAGAAVAVPAALASLRSLRRHKRWAGLVTDGSTLAESAIDLSGLVGYRMVTDFHLVNLAVQHKARLVTFDRGIPEFLLRRDRRHVKLLG